jgi:subtilase family serine protease
MKKRCLSIGLTALSIVSMVLLTLYAMQTRGIVSASAPSPKTLAGYVPSTVTGGQAHLVGQHPGTDQLALAIGLPLRNEQALTSLLHAISTPHNPQFHHYFSQAEANQLFNPTPQQEQQVIAWVQSGGLTVTHTYPNHLLVDVTGTFAQIEQLLHVTINDYTMQLNGQTITFYAPSNEPTIAGPAGSLVASMLGLDDYPWFQATLASVHPTGNGKAHGSPPYYPQDFANAYDVNPLWNAGYTGAGQHIGIVLWSPPPTDPTLTQFAKQTGANVATRANGRLQVIQISAGQPSTLAFNGAATDGSAEAGMDVEYASAMAPGATIDYYQAAVTKQGTPTSNSLDDALNMAGTDANNNAEISDSWGWGDSQSGNECEPASISDPFITQTEQIFQANTLTGHNYFFSSGDHGSACVFNPTNQCSLVKDPYPQYPASSAYVTSVGGTTFSKNINGSYPGEKAWKYSSSTCKNGTGKAPIGSGGGYSNLFSRPAWQVGFSNNQYRGYPDVAADADPATGAYICYNGKSGPICTIFGNARTSIGEGTSLATPLWAGMMADVNQYVQSQGKSPLGFLTPLLYEIALAGQFPAYHDITSGTNGHYQAGPGWDAITGLGSPDLYNLAQDAAILDTAP